MYEDAINTALGKFGDKAMGLAQIMHQDLQKYNDMMLRSIEENNAQDALIAAHSCKSIYGLLSIPEATEIVGQMEHCSHDDSLKRYAELYEEHSLIYKAVIAQLSDILAGAK